MFKTILITFLVAGIIYGAAWALIGRNDLGEIRKNYDKSDGTLQTVLGYNGELGDHIDGFARDITTITTTTKRAENRAGSIDQGLGSVIGDFTGVIGKVDSLERGIRQALVFTRDFGDELYDLRQLNKESGVQE